MYIDDFGNRTGDIAFVAEVDGLVVEAVLEDITEFLEGKGIQVNV